MSKQEILLNGWLVDLAGGKITRDGKSVHLEPLVVKSLAFLVHNRNEVVTKDRMVEAVWGHTDVSDAALTRCIFEIRRAFGDDARKPKVVETIPKVGYRFVANVQSPQTPTETRWPFIKGSVAATVILGFITVLGIQAMQGDALEKNETPIASQNAMANDAFQKGMLHFEKNAYLSNENAIILFERALTFDPEFGLAYAALAQSLVQQFRYWGGDRLVEARTAAEKALELMPSHAQSHYAYGMVLALNGKDREAIDFLHRADALDPGHWQSAFNAGILYKQNLNFKESERLFLQVLEHSPMNVKAMSHLGFLYLRMGQVDDARQWLNQAIDRAPLEVGARSQMAALEMVAGNLDKAIQDCQKVREFYPNQRRCLQVLGASYLIDGNTEEAQAWFDYTAAEFPDSSYAQLGIAQIFLANGHHDKGMEIIGRVSKKALSDIVDSESPWEEYWLLAACHALQDDPSSAFDWLEKAANAGRRFYLWDSTDPVFATLHGDERFDRYIAMTRGGSR